MRHTLALLLLISRPAFVADYVTCIIDMTRAPYPAHDS